MLLSFAVYLFEHNPWGAAMTENETNKNHFVAADYDFFSAKEKGNIIHFVAAGTYSLSVKEKGSLLVWMQTVHDHSVL